MMTPDEAPSLQTMVLQMFKDRDDARRESVASMEKRLDGMNEFRETLSEQARTYVTRPEHEQLTMQVSELRSGQIALQSKLTTAAGIVAVLVTLLSIAATLWHSGSTPTAVPTATYNVQPPPGTKP
jgi:hypothetical protein